MQRSEYKKHSDFSAWLWPDCTCTDEEGINGQHCWHCNFVSGFYIQFVIVYVALSIIALAWVCQQGSNHRKVHAATSCTCTCSLYHTAGKRLRSNSILCSYIRVFEISTIFKLFHPFVHLIKRFGSQIQYLIIISNLKVEGYMMNILSVETCYSRFYRSLR